MYEGKPKDGDEGKKKPKRIRGLLHPGHIETRGP